MIQTSRAVVFPSMQLLILMMALPDPVPCRCSKASGPAAHQPAASRLCTAGFVQRYRRMQSVDKATVQCLHATCFRACILLALSVPAGAVSPAQLSFLPSPPACVDLHPCMCTRHVCPLFVASVHWLYGGTAEVCLRLSSLTDPIDAFLA